MSTDDRFRLDLIVPGDEWHHLETPDSDRIDFRRAAPLHLFVTYTKWHVAVREAADTGNLARLASLLLAEAMPQDVRILLADLFRHRRLKHTGGRPVDPTRVSLDQGMLHVQTALYRLHLARGLDHDEALFRALIDFKIEEAAMRGEELPVDALAESVSDAEIARLDGHLQGRHGTTRRLKKRRRG